MRLQLMLAGESAITIAARGRRATEYKEKERPLTIVSWTPTLQSRTR